jgi:vancomycin resistance protein YoaR
MKTRTVKRWTALLFAGAFFFAQKGEIWKAKADAPYGWAEMSAYTTYFNEKEKERVQNIEIASRLIDGVTVQAYGEFSFNQTVGRRTAEAGFKQAKIIVNGEYAVGVGGGVCQVSTTLYNAVLKAGLTVTEVHPHSLLVGYVAPSRDAMVSTGSDLCFFNPYDFPVYLSAKRFEGGIKIRFLGKNNGDRYEITSKIVGEIPPPDPVVKMGDKDAVLREGRAGIQSEAYVERYRKGALLYKKRIRADVYKPVQGVIVKKNANSDE